MKIKLLTIVLATLLLSESAISQDKSISLTKDGFIPAWIVSGPFEQPLVGFGTPADSDIIGEKEIHPFPGKKEKDALVKNGEVDWFVQSVNSNGFVDFNSSLRWFIPGNSPEKIWYAITGYAAAYIETPADQKVTISFGSNSFGKIFLNGEEIFSIEQSRNAKPDENKIPANLKKGKNLILVKVGNSHNNHELAFFEMIKWEWGFYLKLFDEKGSSVPGIRVSLPEVKEEPSFNLISTFFFRKDGSRLNQRFDLEITSNFIENSEANITIDGPGLNYKNKIDSVPLGRSRHPIYIPEVSADIRANLSFTINGNTVEREVVLQKQPHYELHMMMLAHTDIGYTHPQPVVKEIHCNTLDDVVMMCEQYPEFRWTIETMWQLEQYEQSRTPEQFRKLISLIKQGRVAVSPLYSNPFTGWTGEEELIQTLSLAKKYKEEYGLNYKAAVYNDVPGQSWLIPQVLKNAGVNFLSEGINEIFNDYSFQKSLPKAFIWEGGDNSRVITYLNEAYNEGKAYGLEGRGNFAVQQRMWERINKLKAKGYNYDLILLNTAFGDNSIVPKDQFLAMQAWNKEYEYPKFVSNNVSEFAKEFAGKYGDSLPVLKGDWTSNWDIYYQGEPERIQKHRWVQHNLLSAEKLSALTSLLNQKQLPLNGIANSAYRSILNYSGHGSGLEYGYGSPADNLLTMKYRENYVHDAYLNTEEILQRMMYRIGKPEESFEGEGIIVFNTLSWERSAPVEVQFTAESNQQYEVIDISVNKKIPCFRDEFKLIFVAEALPSLGYKKYRLQPVSTSGTIQTEGLKNGDNFIENQFYRIQFDKSSGIIESIMDKKNSKELIDKKSEYGFNQPLIERFQDNEKYKTISISGVTTEIIDEFPVRVILKITREGNLFESTLYTLWNNIDRVDIEHTADLKTLKTVQTIEEYGFAFPFSISNQREIVEVSGGYLDPAKDKLPGSGNEGYSIRRIASLFNDSYSISWTSTDSRVIRLRTQGEDKTLISNPVNNFPLHWNRYEVNKERLSFHYSFTGQANTFDPGFSSKFGWELSTPPVIRKSWYKSEPASGSYIQIDNKDIGLLTIKNDENGDNYYLRLINFNDKNEEAAITSPLFNIKDGSYCSYLNDELKKIDSVKVNLKPNEIVTIKIKKSTNQVMK